MISEWLTWLNTVAPGAQLSSDSRRIAAGDVFFAYPSEETDGRRYIAHAIEQGAGAVVFDDEDFVWEGGQVPHLSVPKLRDFAGLLANAYYAQPDGNWFTVAATGTNGKTSCTQWLGHTLSRLGTPTAVIGTLGAGVFKQGKHEGFDPTGYTTPDAVQLQRKLAEFNTAGVGALAIEASSIGLDQGRLNGLHIDVALFTNFTRDHLDYHGDMVAYEAAKMRLFDWPGLRHAVINLDDEMGVRLVQHLQHKMPTLSIAGYTVQNRMQAGISVLSATHIHSHHDGTVFHLDTPFGGMQVKTQLVGHFNVSNVLGVIGVLLAKGIDIRTAVGAVEQVTAAPGRMQQLGGHDAPLIVIDYAHTPDALEKTLAALRPIAQERGGQLWCVFGCGGDRDPGKRSQMGAVSQAADHIVVTSDNPRSEDASTIIAQIVAGMADVAPHIVEDRAAAILYAGKSAAKRDVILLAGKGHETYQEIKGKKRPFMDADHAALALAARVTMKGIA